MKTYLFPYGGSFGKGDSWDGANEVELTDEEAVRLEASAHKEPRWHLDEDPEISDIYDKVYEYLYNHDIEGIMTDEDLMEDLRDEHEEDEEPLSDRELAEEYMDNTTFHVCYPEELQDLDEGSDKDE